MVLVGQLVVPARRTDRTASAGQRCVVGLRLLVAHLGDIHQGLPADDQAVGQVRNDQAAGLVQRLDGRQVPPAKGRDIERVVVAHRVAEGVVVDAREGGIAGGGRGEAGRHDRHLHARLAQAELQPWRDDGHQATAQAVSGDHEQRVVVLRRGQERGQEGGQALAAGAQVLQHRQTVQRALGHARRARGGPWQRGLRGDVDVLPELGEDAPAVADIDVRAADDGGSEHRHAGRGVVDRNEGQVRLVLRLCRPPGAAPAAAGVEGLQRGHRCRNGRCRQVRHLAQLQIGDCKDVAGAAAATEGGRLQVRCCHGELLRGAVDGRRMESPWSGLACACAAAKCAFRL